MGFLKKWRDNQEVSFNCRFRAIKDNLIIQKLCNFLGYKYYKDWRLVGSTKEDLELEIISNISKLESTVRLWQAECKAIKEKEKWFKENSDEFGEYSVEFEIHSKRKDFKRVRHKRSVSSDWKKFTMDSLLKDVVQRFKDGIDQKLGAMGREVVMDQEDLKKVSVNFSDDVTVTPVNVSGGGNQGSKNNKGGGGGDPDKEEQKRQHRIKNRAKGESDADYESRKAAGMTPEEYYANK